VARFVVDGSDLVVHMSLWEKFWGFHADIRVPLSSVVSSVGVRNPWLVIRGWRMAGVAWSGSLSYGTRRHGDGYDFCMIRKSRPGVQVDVRSGRFSRFLLSIPEGSTLEDAQAEADRIADAAGVAHRQPIT
jgi:hypothetical protein